MTTPGTLFVVATPIGNLEDLTFRALRTLKEVDLIAAEDTRRTAKLLAHYEIRKPMVSLREHNEARESARLVARLERGEQIALVSDAGTPGIADPGAKLVRLARDHRIRIVPVPGPSAVTALLSVSGLDASEFVFLGFPPAHGQRRTDWFEALKDEDRAIVFFEAPHRFNAAIELVATKLVTRQIMIGREITKRHEEIGYITKYGGNAPLPEQRGEYIILVWPAEAELERSVGDRAVSLIGDMTNLIDLSEDEAVVAVSAINRIRPSALRKAIKRARITAKRASD